MLDDALIARAAHLSSATLHEAAGKRGALPASLKPLASHQRVCGRALPVLSPPGDNLWLHRGIAAAEPGDVLIVDVGDGLEYGYWGEIMAQGAQARGVAGLVITGGVRDSLRMVAMDFPVFSAAVCIQGTGKDPHGAGQVGAPLTLGRTEIRRGDLVFGDADGVVVLPQAEAEAIIMASERRDADEAIILERLRAGETTIDIYDLPREQAR